MKRIYSIALIILVSVFVNPAFSQEQTLEAEAPPAFKTTGDPSLDFFVALSNCVPGDYSEKNTLVDTAGETWLKHKIVKQDADICYAELDTPDDRIMYCEFPMPQLVQVDEQHFLHGVLTNNIDDPNADAIKADQVWTDLKSNYCSFNPQ